MREDEQRVRLDPGPEMPFRRISTLSLLVRGSGLSHEARPCTRACSRRPACRDRLPEAWATAAATASALGPGGLCGGEVDAARDDGAAASASTTST